MTAHFHPTLVLNADYQPLSFYPLSTIGWQDAIRGVMQEKYDIVSEYDVVVRSQKLEMFVPSVVALREYQKITHRVAFTRFNVFLRDDFRCQYCGNKFDSRDLTFEHVVPRSRGGRTTWENIVAACEPCNTAKGHHLEMQPMRMPRKPSLSELRASAMKRPPAFVHETWLDFLYWGVELQP